MKRTIFSGLIVLAIIALVRAWTAARAPHYTRRESRPPAAIRKWPKHPQRPTRRCAAKTIRRSSRSNSARPRMNIACRRATELPGNIIVPTTNLNAVPITAALQAVLAGHRCLAVLGYRHARRPARHGHECQRPLPKSSRRSAARPKCSAPIATARSSLQITKPSSSPCRRSPRRSRGQCGLHHRHWQRR